MITLERCNRLLDDGFSLLTVADNKQPNVKWKELQAKAATKEQFRVMYNMPSTKGVGIITGYGDLECVDVDLKVFSTAPERKAFWEEFLSILDDNILDFDKKFTIYRTKNEGFHILYKTKRASGNTKIAKLKGHTEAVIETRGVGGYVFTYDGQNIYHNTYSSIQYISDADRDTLWATALLYNHYDGEPEKPPKRTQTEFATGSTPWDDYNSKESVLDVVKNELYIVRQTHDKYVVKRHGAKSPHSGYVFKDNGVLYLFSTGTVYPHEKPLSAFAAYAYRDHNGDFSAAARQLYQDGYGDRVRVKPPEIKDRIKINKNDLSFPIDIYPESIQQYIMLCHNTLGSSIDIMGCSFLWLISIITGISMQIEVKKGWVESCNIWMVIVGKAGVGKTPSINNMVFPLQKVNSREIKSFIKHKEKYDHYMSLSKEEKLFSEHIVKPVKTQFIVNDITLEALVDLHEECKNGVAVLKDELAGWLKDMNKYRQGSDLEHWLSSWSGKEINLNRKTAKSSFVERAFIPVLGGIQPEILSSFYTDENKENGFIDRMLFSFPDLEHEDYSESELKQEVIQWYENYIVGLYDNIHSDVIQYNTEREVEPRVCKWSPEAKKEWIRVFNEITAMQRSDEENEYMKSMLPKQKSYIPRFALLMNVIQGSLVDGYDLSVISKESMLSAEKLSKYFIAMAKKIKADNQQIAGARKVVERMDTKTTIEKIQALLADDPEITQGRIAEILGVSRKTVNKYINGFRYE